MRVARRWIVAVLFIGCLAVLAPAGSQGIYEVEPLEGPPGTQVTVTGHLLDCYGGPGEITPYYGFPDRVAYYWNPQAMSSDEGGLLYEVYDADPNDKSGLVELASYEFGESGWTLTFSVPGDAPPGNHYNVVAFEPRCQRFVRNADGTEVEEDRNADNYVTTFCVTDASGTCPTVPSSGEAGGQPEGGTGVASAETSDGSGGGIDPTVAIVAGVILTALGGAGTVASIRKPRGPTTTSGDRYEPRDTNECGAELAHLDAQLNRALTSLRNLADGRSKVRMEKLRFEITAQDCRIKAAEIRSAVARAEGDAAVAVFTGVLGGTFWAMTGTALVASSALVGVIAGWGLYGSGMGIRIWRATEMLKLGDTLYNGIKIDLPGAAPGGRIPLWKLPAIRAWAKQLSAAADLAAQLPDLFANQYNKDLEAKRIAIEAARAESDALWQQRERMFQNCTSAGHLPPGTWHRPAPTYSFDSEGVIIGVGY